MQRKHQEGLARSVAGSSAGATAGSDRPDQEEPVSTTDRFSIKDNERILQAKYEAMKASRDQWVELAEFYYSLNVLDGLPERPKDRWRIQGSRDVGPKLRRPATRVNLGNPWSSISPKTAKASQINLKPTFARAMGGKTGRNGKKRCERSTRLEAMAPGR